MTARWRYTSPDLDWDAAFAAVRTALLKAFEESGRCRRGYFVEGLGGAQFAMPGAVDRLRPRLHVGKL